MRPSPALGVLIASLVAVGFLVQPPQRAKRGAHVPPLLPRPEVLKVLGAPVRSMVADYFWIQTTYATGASRTPEEHRDIYDYAMHVIELDPDFRYVYQFAGGAIPVNLGRETWVNTSESTTLLRLGAARFPDNLMLQIMLSYNLSYFEHQPKEAAEVLLRAAKLPGAPRYLPALATRLYAEAGDFDAGMALTETVLGSSDDPETREAFRIRRLELELERELRQVDAASLKFKEREGRFPEDPSELLRSGDLAKPPVDPLGGSIGITSDGRGFSTAQQRRLRTYKPGDRGIDE